jgi:hypothetical protein
MTIKDWIVPDEVQSASAAAAGLFSVASRTSHFWLKQFVGLVVPFGLGMSLAVLLVDRLLQPEEMESIKQVMVGMLTFVSVLAGFMVTLMLFTGRTQGSSLLSEREARPYVDKVTYLLFAQAITLALHIGCAAICLVWMLLDAVDAGSAAMTWLFYVAFGLLVSSMARSLLLPLQIYELHQFELQAFLDQKHQEQAVKSAKERAEHRGVDLLKGKQGF